MSTEYVQPGASCGTLTGGNLEPNENLPLPDSSSIVDEINGLYAEICREIIRKLQAKAEIAELEFEYIGGTNQLPFLKLAWLSATKEEQRSFRAWLNERRTSVQKRRLIEALEREVE